MRLPAFLCWNPVWALVMKHKPKQTTDVSCKRVIGTEWSYARTTFGKKCAVYVVSQTEQIHHFSFITCSLCGNVIEFHLAEEPVTVEERVPIT